MMKMTDSYGYPILSLKHEHKQFLIFETTRQSFLRRISGSLFTLMVGLVVFVYITFFAQESGLKEYFGNFYLINILHGVSIFLIVAAILVISGIRRYKVTFNLPEKEIKVVESLSAFYKNTNKYHFNDIQGFSIKKEAMSQGNTAQQYDFTLYLSIGDKEYEMYRNKDPLQTRAFANKLSSLTGNNTLMLDE